MTGPDELPLSFVVIAYNEAPNIAACVEAVVAQDGLPNRFDIVLVNDGSVDDTLTSMRRLAGTHPQVRVVDLQPNRGRGAARAAGTEAARGESVAFVDADITLPRDWFARCAECLRTCDACGGIAVPDGDVAYLHQALGLVPKIYRPPYPITGNNTLFRRRALEAVPYDAARRSGEDVDLVFRLAEAGFTVRTVDGLAVTHHEHKSSAETARWLFDSGVGASRQLSERRKVRAPDLAFLGFVVLGVGACASAAFAAIPWWLAAVTVVGYLLVSSLLHLHGRFALHRTAVRSLLAVVLDAGFLLGYYIGRVVGLFSPGRRARSPHAPAR